MDSYRELFRDGTSSAFNNQMELIIENIFSDVKQSNHYDHDACLLPSGKRIEIKTIRAFRPRSKTKRVLKESISSGMNLLEAVKKSNRETLYSRALYSCEESHIEGSDTHGYLYGLANKSVQQVKPEKFDYLLCAVVFRDCIRFYCCKSSDISPNVLEKFEDKINLVPQHGNDKEGVFSLDCIADKMVYQTDVTLEKLSDVSLKLSDLLE